MSEKRYHSRILYLIHRISGPCLMVGLISFLYSRSPSFVFQFVNKEKQRKFISFHFLCNSRRQTSMGKVWWINNVTTEMTFKMPSMPIKWRKKKKNSHKRKLNFFLFCCRVCVLDFAFCHSFFFFLIIFLGGFLLFIAKNLNLGRL